MKTTKFLVTEKIINNPDNRELDSLIEGLSSSSKSIFKNQSSVRLIPDPGLGDLMDLPFNPCFRAFARELIKRIPHLFLFLESSPQNPLAIMLMFALCDDFQMKVKDSKKEIIFDHFQNRSLALVMSKITQAALEFYEDHCRHLHSHEVDFMRHGSSIHRKIRAFAYPKDHFN